MARDFEIIGTCSFKRHVFSICAMSKTKFVIGQQGGFLAMMDVQDEGVITKEAENKVSGAIFKVIKTSVDDFALACSGGLYFARYDSQNKRFTISEDFLLSDHLVTQICEIAMNKFLVGIWGVPWVGYVDKTQKLLVKLNCPSDKETQCTDLATLPGFDINAFPYMI